MTSPEPHGAERREPSWSIIAIALLAAVTAALGVYFFVMPRVFGVPSPLQAREATLQAHLHQIRNALEQFNADTGLYPCALTDLTCPRSAPPATGINDHGATVALPTGSFMGPYLAVSGGIGGTGIPANPYMPAGAPSYGHVTAHWNYGARGPGMLHPAVPASGKTSDGVPFQDL